MDEKDLSKEKVFFFCRLFVHCNLILINNSNISLIVSNIFFKLTDDPAPNDLDKCVFQLHLP